MAPMFRWRPAALCALAAAALVGQGMVAGASAAVTGRPSTGVSAGGGVWHNAHNVPGLAAIGRGSVTQEVACPAPGDCEVAGAYQPSSSAPQQVFVDAEVHGVWGSAQELPHLAALDAGGSGAYVTSLSCPATGDCVAGGYYFAASPTVPYPLVPFLADEVNGTWVNAMDVPGMPALSAGGDTQINSVSCASAGNCAAAGNYVKSATRSLAFVVDEVHGVWHKAMDVPGVATLSEGTFGSSATSVSCAAPGDCAAAGHADPKAGSANSVPFVANEVHGTWRRAQQIRGAADGNGIESISCAKPGNCAAVGSAATGAFVVNEVLGAWRKALTVRGLPASPAGGSMANSVSCAAPGNCATGGWYAVKDPSGVEAFVLSEVNGVWRTALEVPGSGALNVAGLAQIYSVSCAAPGECVAGGEYGSGVKRTGEIITQPMVTSEVNGVWRTAQKLPEAAALHAVGADVFSLSCAAPGACAAGGAYTKPHGGTGAFVASEVPVP